MLIVPIVIFAAGELLVFNCRLLFTAGFFLLVCGRLLVAFCGMMTAVAAGTGPQCACVHHP